VSLSAYLDAFEFQQQLEFKDITCKQPMNLKYKKKSKERDQKIKSSTYTFGRTCSGMTGERNVKIKIKRGIRKLGIVK
jgi:hypothetical protein